MRGDVTWPGGPGELVSKGAKDHEWLPVVGKAGLVVLTRDKRIQKNAVERRALLDNGVRAFFQTAGGELTLFDQLQLWMRWWDEMESMLDTEPGPWLARVVRSGVRIFDRPPDPAATDGKDVPAGQPPEV